MWKYNETETADYNIFSAPKITKENDTLCHSDTYLGADFSDGLKHWKYIKRVMGRNGKYIYYYKNDKLDELETKNNAALGKAMRDSSPYSSIKTQYKDGKPYKTEYTHDPNYSEARAKKSQEEYKKANRKYNAERVKDVPKRAIGRAISFIANLFSSHYNTKATASTKVLNVKMEK